MLVPEGFEPVEYSISETFVELPTHHWSELQGNKFRFKVNPLMLVYKGYVEQIEGNITGRPKGKHHAFLMNVILDKEYVKQKLARECVQPFGQIPKDKFMELMSEVYDSYHNEKADYFGTTM